MNRSKNKEAFLDLDKITIIGGMGFIGSQLTAKLSKFCKKIVILTRNKASNSGITVLPNLEIIQVDINDERTLKEYTKDSDILINLVGILNEFDKTNTFKMIHYDLVKKISNAIQVNKIKRLDLHGLSLQQANKTVKKFIIQSFEDGYKKLLIITGKGLRSKVHKNPYLSEKMNILKNSVPEFIKNDEDLFEKISRISTASFKDGREGAFYIFLKK